MTPRSTLASKKTAKQQKKRVLTRISHSLGWWAAFYVPKGRESATDGFGVVRCTLKSG